MRPPRRQTLPLARRWRPTAISALSVLLAVQGAFYAGQVVIELITNDLLLANGWLLQALGLQGAGIAAGHYWQFLSFPFVQAGPLYALGNLALLYLAGRNLEPFIGARDFLAIYGLGNLLGGVGHWLVAPGTVLLGTVGGSAALLLAYTTILPEWQGTMRVPYFGRVPFQSKHLVFTLLGGCLALWAAGQMPGLGPVAVLVGAAVGWGYARYLGYGKVFFFQRYWMARRLRAARLARMGAEEFINTEVDPLLEKISRQGLGSLTRPERRILIQASEKVAARRRPGGS